MACIRIALARCKSKNSHAELETKKRRVCVYLGIWAASLEVWKHMFVECWPDPILLSFSASCLWVIGCSGATVGQGRVNAGESAHLWGAQQENGLIKVSPPQTKHIIECFSIHRSLKSACNKNRSGRNYRCSIGAWNQPAPRNHFLLRISRWGLRDLRLFNAAFAFQAPNVRDQ